MVDLMCTLNAVFSYDLVKEKETQFVLLDLKLMHYFSVHFFKENKNLLTNEFCFMFSKI